MKLIHTNIQLYMDPCLFGFHYRLSYYHNFWLMYAQVGIFRVSRGPPTFPQTQISHNAIFFKFQNPQLFA